MTRPIGIDLFAGAGGLSLGFEQAGFDVVAAVEIDPVHCAVHKFNFPNCAVLPRSVSSVTGADIREAAGLASDAKVDVVFGGPPCQGFSMIGQRSLDDPRNRLVYDFVRLVTELDASYFVFENVKGLTVGRQRKFLEEVVEAFQSAGYEVRLPWKVFNAADYGVPQLRERLILMGCKKGLDLPSFPEAITRAAVSSSSTLPAGPTVSEAIGDLPDADVFEELVNTDFVPHAQFGEPSRYAAELRGLTNDAWHFGYKRKWDPTVLTSSWRTDHTAISRRRFAETPSGQTEPISRFYKLDAQGVSNTLRAGTDGARGAFTSPRPIHYKHSRCVTVREMARLHGFPDWFRLHSTKWHGARQIGNSVPPPLARAVATSIVRAIGVEAVRPSELVELGDEALLYTTVGEAAQLLGVTAPKTKRDKNSNIRKRKQHETEAERLANLEAMADG
ncbi:DNA cytosine methyltransferase [Pseudorhizobium flavum]|uniref:DNA cytosine methyltransferase n=1 Tax=Pseudorhizobium flavum TaxID=1335061 RepID=UPI00248FB5DA|nr:DNA cytosine methyltransferase [Pseudorhizobium flavum]